MNESDKKAYLEYLQKEHGMNAEDAAAYFDYVQKTTQQEKVAAAEINKEEAADIPLRQRMAVKAFGTDPEQAANYLKRKNPEMDFVVKDGEIYGKKMGEKGAYKALDPSSLELADIADLAYDIPAGVVQGSAATAAALPGIALLNPAIALGGASAGSAASGAGLEGLRQMIGKSLGVSEEFSPEQIGLAGGIGALAPGASSLLAKGAKGAVPALKKGVGRMMGMSKEEAKAMLENPALFETAKEAFKGNAESSVKTQAATKQAFSNLVEDLKQVGLAENEALNLSLIGTNVDVDMNSLRKTLGQITNEKSRKQAAKLLQEARNYIRSQRPFQPEMATEEAQQLGVQGLTQPSRIIPSEVVATEAVPEQMAFFEAEQVMKPEYKKIPQPPKAPQESLLDAYKPTEPTEAELEAYYKYKELYDAFSPRAKNPRTYNYLKDIADKPIEPDQLLAPTVAKTEGEQLSDLAKYIKAEEALRRYEAKFPQLKQAQAPELMLPPTPSMEKVPASITPAYSEMFPAETVQFTTLLQEPLELAGKKGIPAPLARGIRQLLQKEAKYTLKGTPSQRVFSDEADQLNALLRQTKGLQEKEAAMGMGKDLQKRIAAMERAQKPISAITKSIEDVDIRARVEQAATRAAAAPKKAGQASFKQVQNTLSAAKKFANAEQEAILQSPLGAIKALGSAGLGFQHGGARGAILAPLAAVATSPKVYSKMLPVAETIESGIKGVAAVAEPFTRKIPNYSTLPLWMEMIRNKQGEKK